MNKLTPIIFILVSIGIFFFVIDPQYKETKVIKEEIKKYDELIVLANKLRDKREALEKKYESISLEDRKILSKILPDTVDNVRLILDINNIASDVGITIADIGIDTEDNVETGNNNVIDRTSTKDYGTISLSFSVSATYETFKKFLSRLEDSLRLVDIVDFSVNASEESDFYGYDLTINTYWLR
jgi:hypothetical protein